MHFYFYDCFLFFIGLIAGTIDTLAGGGGLITVPALLFTGINIIPALGTNKLQSAIGELSATLRFWKSGQLSFHGLAIPLFFTVIGSAIGTITLQYSADQTLNKIVPWLLLAILLYYYLFPNLHFNLEKRQLPIKPKILPWMGTVIGFYNGFFGPGTGAIWTISLMQIYKLRINTATIITKPLNIAGNITALSIFISGGQINYFSAFIMGVGSFIGGQIGASLVIYKSSRFLRVFFLIVMTSCVFYSFVKYYNIHFV
ncbi:TSUP family transporter [Commensalibacter sp. M0134]|uniref:sulfite exporter TauE/SafE family protein n=1 Tax=Commensalibacter TaxID=1079922 RepID=UPI0018DE5B4F|nr:MULTISPECIES: TSUP family transporter [Commensalibacter]MBI0066544.1 TSUP family transporter [Commensalibacter sp. M0134]MBI0070426.1 TSUP family transporter [Commensalibacter sp. M0133]MBI0081859.1 TSUP family transporter [Commensalibacter melissae]